MFNKRGARNDFVIIPNHLEKNRSFYPKADIIFPAGLFIEVFTQKDGDAQDLNNNAVYSENELHISTSLCFIWI